MTSSVAILRFRILRWVIWLVLVFELCQFSRPNGFILGEPESTSMTICVDDDDYTDKGECEDNRQSLVKIDGFSTNEISSSLELSKTDSFYLLNTVDGSLHAVTGDGEKLWSTDDVGGPTVKTYQKNDALDIGIIVGDNGNLYFYSEESGLMEHYMSIPDVVSASPFLSKLGTSPADIRVIGEKTTSMFELDPHTGKQRRVFSSRYGQNMPSSFADVDNHQSIDSLLISRVDYRIRAFHAEDGTELWNISYGEFTTSPNGLDEPVIDPNFAKNPIIGRPGRLTMGNVPVVSVFGVQNVESDKFRLTVRKSETIRERLLDYDPSQSEVVYVRNLVFRDGKSQLFATTAESAKDYECPPNVDGTGLLPVEDACLQNGVESPLLGAHFPRRSVVPYNDILVGLPFPFGRPLFGPNVTHLPGTPPNENLYLWKLAVAVLLAAIVIFVSSYVLVSARRQFSNGVPVNSSSDSAEHRVPVYNPETNTERVGDLIVSLDTESVLGTGGSGTTVLKGSLRGRPVAVKRVLSVQYKLAEKEIDLLIRSDEHPNIVRYFHTEMTRDFIFLALELCDATLEQAIPMVRMISANRTKMNGKKARKNLSVPPGTVRFLEQVVGATRHLHSLKIVHCDIKPANILVMKLNEGDIDNLPPDEVIGLGDIYEAKLSDMGLGRKFVGNTSSIWHGTSMHGSGTVGWRSPELIRSLSKGNRGVGPDDRDYHDVAMRLGRKVDVFAVGCVFFYILTNGHHPFGGSTDRERNILDSNPVNLNRIEHFKSAHDLIGRMVSINPSDRPSMNEAAHHPLLWDSSKQLDFLRQVSDRLEAERTPEADMSNEKKTDIPTEELDTPIRDWLESHAEEIIGRQGWLQRLHPTLRHHVVSNKHRYYSTHSVHDLLRYIRNRVVHFRELDDETRDLLSPFPIGLVNNFLGSLRFPALLHVCYDCILKTCAHEKEFKSFLGSCIVSKYENESRAWRKEVSSSSFALKSEKAKEVLKYEMLMSSPAPSFKDSERFDNTKVDKVSAPPGFPPRPAFMNMLSPQKDYLKSPAENEISKNAACDSDFDWRRSPPTRQTWR